MLARIPEEIIQRVQEAVDIADVISRYATLKRAGRNFKALCPFHEEKTPSFTVFPESQRFKCFGCGEGGNVFTFLMKHNNLGFRDVLEELARDAAIELPRADTGPEEAERAKRRAGAFDALRFAAGFFRAVLGKVAGRPALDYLASRGFETATLERFEIGFAPDDWEALSRYARGKGFSEQALLDAGLLRRSEDGRIYGMFRRRVMFPIHDMRGNVIGFGARAMGDDQPKYLNSPDGPLFHKGRELYGVHLARADALKAGRILVMEGYTDVLAAHQAGLTEAVATLGTAFTSDNAKNLRRVGVPVFLVYDGDTAGQKAAERATDVLLAEGVEGSVAILSEGQDPADLLAASGKEAFEAVLGGAQDLFEFRVDATLARHGTGSLSGESRAIEELVATISHIAEPIRLDVAFKLLAERVSVPESTLRNSARSRAPRPSEVQNSPVPSAWRKMEGEFVGAALEDPAIWEQVESVYPSKRFEDPALRVVAEWIGRLVEESGHVTRESLWSVLEGAADALCALEGLELPEDVVERARVHLETLARKQRLQSALEAEEPLTAVRSARMNTGTEA
ncbi:MAG: DNA primase [Planctomycetota bacterium]|nr:DNA primase [Planctomycetota bacterium]